jgi:hypothetical protein
VADDAVAESTPQTAAPLNDERLNQGIIVRVNGAINESAAIVSEFEAQAPLADCQAVYDTYLAFLRQSAADTQEEGIEFYERVAAVRHHDVAALNRLRARGSFRRQGPGPAQARADAVNRELARLHSALVVRPD